MAPGPITACQIEGETWKLIHFFFLDSKITVDSDYSHEMKRRLLLGKKTTTNLDTVLLCRDITLPTKVCIVKAMIFPKAVYGCGIWTIKKAGHQRIDAF